MKKLSIIICFLFILMGCTKQQDNAENLNFNGTNLQEERYEYKHGVANYQFEQWVYNGNELDFNYDISNLGKECEFGLVFLIDGIPQDYSVDGKNTSMYTVNMKTDENKTLSIKMKPKIDTKKNICNFNAFLILNPSTHINDIKQYGHNHSVSSAPTISLVMNEFSIDKNLKIEKLKSDYQDISAQTIKDYTKDGINMLDNNIYIERNYSSDDEKKYVEMNDFLELKAYGKQGQYRVLEYKNNYISHMYDIVVKKDKYLNIKLDSNFEKNDNIYFLIVPLDAQDSYDYVMLNQSERWIVK